MRKLLEWVLEAYDAFMLSDMDTHVTNKAWLELTNVMHVIRVYLSKK